MTSQLETELRELFSARADEVPPEAFARVASGGYHPRTRSPRVLALCAVGVAIAATVASVAFSTTGPARQNAFASWSATPTVPAGDQLAAADATCLSTTEQEAAESETAGTAPGPQSPSPFTSPDTWQVKLTDTRGPFSFVVLEATSASQLTGLSSCFVSTSGPSAGRSLNSIGGAPIPSNADGQLFGPASISVPLIEAFGMSGDNFVTAAAGTHVGYVIGEAGSSVLSVSLNLSDGTSVVATVQNGAYAAWWPSSASVVSAGVTTAQGTTTQTFPVQSIPRPGG
jgi:hypothetical protein